MNDHATMSPAGAPVPPAGGNRPEPADDFEVLLITGMSGAGRSHAADCVEDMGWYVSTICHRNYWSRWST